MTTFAEYLSTGTGLAEFRVRIEGCPLEFCTSHAMGGVLGGAFAGLEGVRRVGGLLREGLSFSESCYMPGADYKATLGAVVIEDTDESVAWNLRAASSVFSKIPRTIGYLSSGAASGDTVLYVRDTSGFAVGSVYHCDTEAFRVDTVIDATTLEVTRGMWGTTAQGHFVATSTLIGERTLTCPIWDAVPTYRKRRAWIYGHGESEFGLDTSGTLIARGVVAGAPSLSDGTTWSFSIAPMTSLLDTDIGPREGQAAFRGIYYPGASPLRIHAAKLTDANAFSAVTSSVTVNLVGFYESQAAFCTALDTALNADSTISAWGVRFSARPVGDGWELYVTTGSPAIYIRMGGGSAADGIFDLDLLSALGGLAVGVVSADTEYLCTWTGTPRRSYREMGPQVEGLRGVPRGQYYAWREPASTPADVAAYPWFRLYLASVAGISVGDIVRVGAPEGVFASWEAPVATVNADNGWIEIDPDQMWHSDAVPPSGTLPIVGDRGIWTLVTPESMPSLTLLRDYGTGINFADFLAAVYTDAVNNANAGVVPFLLEGDFAAFADLEAAVLEAAAGQPWLLSRSYRFASAVRFSDVFKHECRLYGLFPATTSTGAITLRPLLARLDEDHVIASSDLINDDSLGEIQIEPDGVVTGLTVRTGYDPVEDEHKGRVYEITMLHALSAQRTRMALEVAPKTRAAGTEPSYEDLLGHVQSPASMWSKQRSRVSIAVKATFHAALIGDVVYATIPQLPYDGERGIDGGGGGIVATRGTITGRTWEFADPSVLLDIDFDSLDVAGYTPTGRITATAGAATTWTVTLDADEYGPGGAVADASFFVAGMRVRVMEWDDDAPTERDGIVTSVSGNDVAIEFDASWTPGASVWNLLFAESTGASLTAAQLRYAWIARSGGRVQLASGTQATRSFAP